MARLKPFLFVPISHEFIDYDMAGLDPSAVVVLLCIAREAFKHSNNDGRYSMSIEQIASGGIRRGGGKPSTRGTGLSRSTVKRAINSLIEAGLIEREEHVDPHGINLPNTYHVLFDEHGEDADNFELGGSVGGPTEKHEPTSTDELGGAADGPLLENNSEREQKTEQHEQRTPLPLIEESEKNTDEQAEQGSVEDEIVRGEQTEAYSALKLAIRNTPGLRKPSGKLERDMIEALEGMTVWEGYVVPVVRQFAKEHQSAYRVDLMELTRGIWLDRLTGDEPLSLDVDSVVARVERRMNGASNEMSRALDKLMPPQFPRDAAPPADGVEWVGDLPEFAVRWNTVVKSGPPVVIWDRTGWDHKNLVAAIANKGWSENIDKVLEKCQSILEVGNPLSAHITFSWLLKPGNYATLLNGGANYAAKPEKRNGASVAPPTKEFPPGWKLERPEKKAKEIGRL